MPEQVSDGLERNLRTQQVNRVRVPERVGSAPTVDLDGSLLQPPLNHRTEA
jgi:hypothetical protein